MSRGLWNMADGIANAAAIGKCMGIWIRRKRCLNGFENAPKFIWICSILVYLWQNWRWVRGANERVHFDNGIWCVSLGGKQRLLVRISDLPSRTALWFGKIEGIRIYPVHPEGGLGFCTTGKRRYPWGGIFPHKGWKGREGNHRMDCFFIIKQEKTVP